MYKQIECLGIEILVSPVLFISIQALLVKADSEQRKSLKSGYDMITNPAKMGERFKFLSLHANKDKDYVPAGFKALS